MMLSESAGSPANIGEGEEIIVLPIDLLVEDKHRFRRGIYPFDQGRGTNKNRQLTAVEHSYKMRCQGAGNAAVMYSYASCNDFSKLPIRTEVLINPFGEVANRCERIVFCKRGGKPIGAIRRRDEHECRPVLLALQL